MTDPTPAPVARAAGSGGLAEAWRFVKAQLSSGAATFVDWVLVTATIFAFGDRSYPAAVAVGALAGAVTDFSIKRRWVFDARGTLVRSQAWRYAVVSGASLAWNELLSWVAVDRLLLPAIPGVIGASILIGAAWNYPMHRLFVFRRAVGEGSTE